MNPLQRLYVELSAVRRSVSTMDFATYLGMVALELPKVIARKTLAPADARMNRDVIFTVNGNAITVPIGKINRILRGHDDTPTFGGLREMFASNVYLRGFRPDISLRTVVDLGANRGLFSTLAVAAYGSRIAIGVEAKALYEPVADALRAANQIGADSMPRVTAFISSSSGANRVTMKELMARYTIEQIDFLKCDIEGGEFDVFLDNREFLGAVSNIAMEMHPDEGDCRTVISAIANSGFRVRATDQFNKTVGFEAPHYLYASRRGDLQA